MARIAVSIQTLTDEVHVRSPQTTIYHYDNGPARDSDHDPNDYDVICACDIMQGHGLDLHKLSREIVASRHPECAYVIFNEQIASRNTGWKWVDYHGESDHSDHIHVSVGVGKDGYKKPPYDSTERWLGADMADLVDLTYAPRTKPAAIGNRSAATLLADLWGQELLAGSPIDGDKSPRTEQLARIEAKLDKILAEPPAPVIMSDADREAIAIRTAKLVIAGLGALQFLPHTP